VEKQNYIVFFNYTNLTTSGSHKTEVDNKFMPRVLRNGGKTHFIQI